MKIKKNQLNQRFSKLLAIEYMTTLYAKETIMAISPAPALATGPVHHSWDMHTTMRPMALTMVHTAANPLGKLGCLGLFQACSIS